VNLAEKFKVAVVDVILDAKTLTSLSVDADIIGSAVKPAEA
tara:strand:+ start:399 stop:521 length:123 start_codon:yes stop_codon:yes gene_type:complete